MRVRLREVPIAFTLPVPIRLEKKSAGKMDFRHWPVLSGIAGSAKSAVIGESGFQRRRVGQSEKEHRTIGDRVAKSEAATQDSLEGYAFISVV